MANHINNTDPYVQAVLKESGCEIATAIIDDLHVKYEKERPEALIGLFLRPRYCRPQRK